MSSPVIDHTHEPTPTSYGRLTWFEKIGLVLSLATSVPIALVAMLFRRLVFKNEIPIKDDLIRSIVRRLFGIPVSILRKIMAPDTVEETLNSTRVRLYKHRMCEEVQNTGFCGWWVHKGWGDAPLPPNQCDLVILFIHGGAYTLGHPLSNLEQRFRIAELLAAQNISSSLFALKYSLTPEAKFPTQFQESEAAFMYLVNDMAIDPSKIVVMGESAGGHLSLSLLYTLAHRGLPRPGAAFLLAPWIDLTNSDPTVTTNKNRDILARKPLEKAVGQLFGSPEGREKHSHLLNFASPERPGLPLQNFLPSFTWVTAGSDEIFLGSIKAFVANALAAGLEMELQVGEGKDHGWQTSSDLLGKKKYIQLEPTSPVGDLMLGAENIAAGLMEIIKRRKVNL